MQAAFQEFTDSAVSKTINLPATATTEEIKEAYLLAYRLGCKGITVYRDGARPDQVMNVGKSKKVEEKAAVSAPTQTEPKTQAPAQPEAQPEAQPVEKSNDNGSSLSMIAPRPRPEVMTGTTTRKRTSCGDLYLTVNRDETEHPFEAFATMGKAGGCEGSFNEAIGRLISLCMRAGVTPRDIVKQLIGIRCNKPFGLGKEKVLSCSDAIAKIFNQSLGNKVTEERYPDSNLKGTTNGATNGAANGTTQTAPVLEEPTSHIQKVIFPCPECGLELEFGEGCEKCHFCGYSRCY
jgi:ribonucleoside-diphosphate reductase alpha chain